MEEEFIWGKLKQHPTPEYLSKAVISAMKKVLGIGMTGIVTGSSLMWVSGSILFFIAIPLVCFTASFVALFYSQISPALNRASEQGWTVELYLKASNASREPQDINTQKVNRNLSVGSSIVTCLVIALITILALNSSVNVALVGLIVFLASILPLRLIIRNLELRETHKSREWVEENDHLAYEAPKQPLKDQIGG